MFSVKTDTFIQVSVCRLPLQIKRHRKLLEKIAEKATRQHTLYTSTYLGFIVCFNLSSTTKCAAYCVFCSSVYCRQGGPCVVGRIFALVLLHTPSQNVGKGTAHTQLQLVVLKM